MVINIITVHNEWWASPRLYTIDSRLLPSGNPFKYNVVAFSLYSPCNSILLLPCFRLYYIVSVLFLSGVPAW